jgi:hypothetical protein
MSESAKILNISLSNTTDSGGSVMIEQNAWSPYTGYLTKGGAVAYLYSLLFGDPEDAPAENCGATGGVDGNAATGTVYTYPTPHTLQYKFAVSNANITGPFVEFLEFAEVAQIQNTTEVRLQYPTKRIISAEWLSKGLGLPDIIITEGRVRVKKPTMGSMLVVYEVVRHTWEVAVNPRLDSTKNVYQNYIYAVWDGGNSYLEYTPPPDAQEGDSGSDSAECNSKWKALTSLGLDPDSGYTSGDTDITLDKDNIPVAPSLGDIEKSWNYCENKEATE